MNYDTIRLDHDNGILWLTLNRPQMLNAFTLQMADELIDAFGRAIDRRVDGFHARVVQHECDHLDGILYPMRIRDFRRFGFVEELFPDGNAGAAE